MSLKIGDKVRMTPRGFKYYSNLDIAFDSHSVARVMAKRHFTGSICELFAIHGIGTIQKFSSDGEPYIRWEYSLDGIHYYYTHYYGLKDVKKMSFLDKLIFAIQGRY
jgi:hypothetical protein